MGRKLVYHHNFIGHEINESLEFYKNDVFDREVYCRKNHRVMEPKGGECEKCPCFAGYELGHGHECAWEDVVLEEHKVDHDDRYKEYERVDKLIKQGILKEIKDIAAFNVKKLSYDKEVWIYEQSEDMENRYLLGKRGNKTLVCCGVNPSTASPENLDATMNRVEALVKNNAYDSYIMINLYPMRATNPDEMHRKMNNDIVEENLKHVSAILSTGNCDVCAAWGNLIEKRAYLKDCLIKIADIAKLYNCKWYTFGAVTKSGHPRHPLYLAKETKVKDFDISAYIEKLK